MYRRTPTRKSVAIPKFYFFDIGVVNALLNRFDVSPESELFGKALEPLILCELKAFLSYRSSDLPITYWRSRSKLEVDFVLGDEIAIEVKSSRSVHARDEKGIRAFTEDVSVKRKIIVCRERYPRTTESGVEIFPIEEFLGRLWAGDIVAP